MDYRIGDEMIDYRNFPAVTFWILCGCLGYLIDETIYGVVLGVAFGTAYSLFALSIKYYLSRFIDWLRKCFK